MLTRERLGQRIAEERKRAGLTQKQLATALGLERTAITRIEQGQQGVDTLQLTAIADTLGVLPAAFFEPVEEQPLEVLLRAPGTGGEEVLPYLEWLEAFLRDYEFLREITSQEGAT